MIPFLHRSAAFRNSRAVPIAAACAAIILALGLILAFWLKAPSEPSDGPPRRATLEGELSCLPRPQGYPSGRPCPLALRLDDGRRYVLEFSLMSSVPETHEEGDRVSAAGVLIPAERASDREEDGAAGIFAVTDSFKVIK